MVLPDASFELELVKYVKYKILFWKTGISKNLCTSSSRNRWDPIAQLYAWQTIGERRVILGAPPFDRNSLYPLHECGCRDREEPAKA